MKMDMGRMSGKAGEAYGCEKGEPRGDAEGVQGAAGAFRGRGRCSERAAGTGEVRGDSRGGGGPAPRPLRYLRPQRNDANMAAAPAPRPLPAHSRHRPPSPPPRHRP